MKLDKYMKKDKTTKTISLLTKINKINYKNITEDKKAGAIYIKISKGKVVATVPISSLGGSGMCHIDYDKNDKIVGVEVLY